MATLVFAEISAGQLSPLVGRAVTAALHLGHPVDVLVAGHQLDQAVTQASALAGVREVLVADDPRLANDLAEPLAEVFLGLAQDYQAILAAATSLSKATFPRIAALSDVMQVSEAIEIVSANTFKRPTYAGNAVETIQSNDAKLIITVRASSFPAASPAESAAPTRSVVPQLGPSVSQFVSRHFVESQRPELSSARVIVSGGRAFGSKEKFDELLEPLADKLGGAIGATRAAVDAGYAGNELQVGQTGTIVAPDLYIACGISGAIQHLAGMKDARVVVAINSDPDAPIMRVADYAIIGDVFSLLPALTRAL